MPILGLRLLGTHLFGLPFLRSLLLCVGRAVSDHVYMPAAADAGPAAFMKWLKEYGGGGPPVTKLKDPFVGRTPPGEDAPSTPDICMGFKQHLPLQLAHVHALCCSRIIHYANLPVLVSVQ